MPFNNQKNHIQPKVTVGYLCYNTGPHVIQAIKSVLNSSYTNLEHIVLDDCSTDDSYQLLDDFIRNNSVHVRLERNLKNLGIARSWNKVISLATGEYFQPVADDFLLANKIEEDVLSLQNAPVHIYATVSIGQFFKIHPENPDQSFHGANNQFETNQAIPPIELLQSLLIRNWICAPTTLFRTSYIQSHPYPVDYSIEDYPFWVKNAIDGYSIKYRSKVTVLYRKGPHSLTNQHPHDMRSLNILHDKLRCELLIAERLNPGSNQSKRIRDSINLLQYGSSHHKMWMIELITKLKLKGPIFWTFQATKHPIILRIAWYISRFTSKV